LPQQPFGHELAVHTQAPARQVSPAPHAGLPPQLQPPALEQLSAIDGSHGTQAAPADPQVVVDADAHVAPEQQPIAQILASQPAHTPPVQAAPAQFWQAAPPVPQLALLVPARQMVIAQQPPGHEIGSQAQVPFTQRCPARHAAPLPHAH